MQTKNRSVYRMCIIGLMAALICILGPMSIQVGPIPFSLTMVAIYLAAFLLGRWAAVSYLVYYILGLVGLPIFSGYTGGIGKAVGPTGGCLLGFFFTALIAGFAIEWFDGKPLPCFFGLAVSILPAYILGIIWFIAVTGASLSSALAAFVAPFWLLDLVKVTLCTAVGSLLRGRIKASGLLPAQRVAQAS